jgi:L-fuconolactonase
VPDTAVAVDAHHHVWDPGADRHEWLDDPVLASLRRSFSMADYRIAAHEGVAGRTVARTVVVQTLASVSETRDLLALAASDELVGAVVGWIDLTDPGCGDVLDELLAAPGGQFLRGVRHLAQDEADPRWLLRPDVLRGLEAVDARGLVFDALVRPAQLTAAVELAHRLPTLTVVLDHAGKPDLRSGRLADWSEAVRAMARAPRTRCKVSGLVTEAPWDRWRSSPIRQAVEHVLEQFGPERCMFGSDWPVSLLAAEWSEWADATAELLSDLDPHDVDSVVRGTATDVYRLDLTTRSEP